MVQSLQILAVSVQRVVTKRCSAERSKYPSDQQ